MSRSLQEWVSIRLCFHRSVKEYREGRIRPDGRKRVERLIHEASLIGCAGRIYRRIPGLRRFYERHNNIRLNQTAPKGLNQQWVANLTYIRVGNEWRYLAAVLDVYSRKVIGWSLGSRKTANLTLRALRHALRVRMPRPDLIFHKDRGVEYRAYLIRNELSRHGIRPSMNRPNQCMDNAHMESFSRSLKAEAIHDASLKSEREQRVVLSGHINQFYNQNRLHSGIDYRAPGRIRNNGSVKRSPSILSEEDHIALPAIFKFYPVCAQHNHC